MINLHDNLFPDGQKLRRDPSFDIIGAFKHTDWSSREQLRSLVKVMLCLNPSGRPSAGVVVARLKDIMETSNTPEMTPPLDEDNTMPKVLMETSTIPDMTPLLDEDNTKPKVRMDAEEPPNVQVDSTIAAPVDNPSGNSSKVNNVLQDAKVKFADPAISSSLGGSRSSSGAAVLDDSLYLHHALVRRSKPIQEENHVTLPTIPNHLEVRSEYSPFSQPQSASSPITQPQSASSPITQPQSASLTSAGHDCDDDELPSVKDRVDQFEQEIQECAGAASVSECDTGDDSSSHYQNADIPGNYNDFLKKYWDI